MIYLVMLRKKLSVLLMLIQQSISLYAPRLGKGMWLQKICDWHQKGGLTYENQKTSSNDWNCIGSKRMRRELCGSASDTTSLGRTRIMERISGNLYKTDLSILRSEEHTSELQSQ